MAEFLAACAAYPFWAFLTFVLVGFVALVVAAGWPPLVYVKRYDDKSSSKE